jgi:2-amino-4-hydroxy-6-hydroxymethyldihydropteridine diphosphokinase
MTSTTAYIGLGANMGDARATLRSAVGLLAQLDDTKLTGLSSLFRSAPLGPAGQSDYLNAVARLSTSLTPHQLLGSLQMIEDRHGRVRAERWGPRTLDLDLLLYGNDRIMTRDLVIPHPELQHRNFVLVPMLQISSDIHTPDGQSLGSLPAARELSGLHELVRGSGWAIDAKP